MYEWLYSLFHLDESQLHNVKMIYSHTIYELARMRYVKTAFTYIDIYREFFFAKDIYIYICAYVYSYTYIYMKLCLCMRQQTKTQKHTSQQRFVSCAQIMRYYYADLSSYSI